MKLYPYPRIIFTKRRKWVQPKYLLFHYWLSPSSSTLDSERLANKNHYTTFWDQRLRQQLKIGIPYAGDTFSTDHLGIFPQREKGKGGLC